MDLRTGPLTFTYTFATAREAIEGAAEVARQAAELAWQVETHRRGRMLDVRFTIAMAVDGSRMEVWLH